MSNIVAFDLEIAKTIPEGTEDWNTLRPYGISCAATLVSGSTPIVWHGQRERDGRLAAQMSKEECRCLAWYMEEMAQEGFTVVTFNGLGFDFDVLAEECQDAVTRGSLVDLALNHIDVAFAMFCDEGFMVGLDTAAKGMGLEGKTEGMHGDLAPVMWVQGPEGQNKVLEYVAQDVVTTLEVYESILEHGYLRWVSKRSRRNYWDPVQVAGRLMTVSEALMIPEPDTSWMTTPWRREKFYGWTQQEEK